MRRYGKITALALMILATLGYTVLPLRCEILSPRIGAPAILKSGARLDISVKHSMPYALGEWRFALRSDMGDEIELNAAPVHIGFGQSQFSASLPAMLDADAYSLLIRYGRQVQIAQHAVHVVNSYNRDLKLVQLADLPTLGDAKGDQQLAKIIEEINIINPDLVLFSGDVAYGASWRQYQILERLLQDVAAPLILAPGNHEYYGWAGFLTTFGQPYHAVQYGDYRIISLNSGHGRDEFSYSQLRWFKRQLEKSEQSQRIVQLHHPVFHRPELEGYLRGNVPSFTHLIKQHKVSVVLSGHWHGDSLYNERGEDVTDTWRVEGTPYVVTTTAGADFRPAYSNSPLHYGYRLLRYRDAELENFTYDYDGDGVRDPSSSIPFNNLQLSQTGPQSFSVSNTLNEGFKSAMLHVAIAETSAEVCASVGQIVKVRRHYRGKDHYWVIVDIPAQRELAINLIEQGQCP